MKFPKTIFKFLFNKGMESFNAKEYKLALQYYNECENMFESYKIMQIYSTTKDDSYLYNQKIWINSIMEQAVIYYSQSKLTEACEKWKKISAFDSGPYENYKTQCINR
jgi:tetratricopeptide (TPR) repeat protein